MQKGEQCLKSINRLKFTMFKTLFAQIVQSMIKYLGRFQSTNRKNVLHFRITVNNNCVMHLPSAILAGIRVAGQR